MPDDIQKIAWGNKAPVTQDVLLKLSEISIWLDTFDDIFSDFDPRPYSVRSLSDDFLIEMRKAIKEKEIDSFELRLLIPKDKRSTENEKIVRKRLHDYFKKQYHLYNQDFKTLKMYGILYSLLGFILMFVSSYISTIDSSFWLFNFIFVILEPTGWFMTWYGLEQLFYKVPQKKEELSFFGKMARCTIEFISY
ncbi:MAG: hypothetical protein WC254_05705 [Candidatus Woesearchaeota archaeon]|jgi:hypothetical protein